MGNKARFKSASACLLAFVGAACVPAYIASPVHAPLFTDEGEVNVAMYTGTTNIDLLGGVALTENLALLVDASLSFSDSRYAFGGGGGYFTTLGDMWRLELYGGFAGGPTAGTEPIFSVNGNVVTVTNQPMRTGMLIRPWAQATFGLSTTYVDVAWVNRLSFVQVKWNPDVTSYDPTSDGFFYEPVFLMRIGYKYIKAEAQFGLSVVMGNTAGRPPSNLGWHTAFGLHFVWDFWGEDDAPKGSGPVVGSSEPDTTPAPASTGAESGAVGEVSDVPVGTDDGGAPDDSGAVDADATGESAETDDASAATKPADDGADAAVEAADAGDATGGEKSAATPAEEGADPKADAGKKKKKKKKGKRKRKKKKKKK